MIAVVILQSINAQGVLRGLVTDKDTHEPIIGATISDAVQRKPLTVTNADGCFIIPKKGDTQQIKITYIGYKPLTIKATANGHYELQAEVSKLGEVVVTAQESKGLTSASKIEKHAMEHLQPSSFADLLELLPGGSSKDPVLSANNNIRLREASPQGSNYATSSLGTSFLVDGARISTNANMQQVNGAWESVYQSREHQCRCGYANHIYRRYRKRRDCTRYPLGRIWRSDKRTGKDRTPTWRTRPAGTPEIRHGI